MRPLLLILIPLDAASTARVATDFEILVATNAAAREQACAERGKEVRVVLTNGAIGMDATLLARLPAVELLCALGVGYENLPLDAARARNIVVTNGAGTNDDCVADHAFALLLGVVRAIPALDRATRDGKWRDDLPMQPNVSGKNMGILGLGNIGRKVAQRAAAFNMPVGYHNRRSQPDSPYRYFDSVLSLASWADYLVIAIPGGGDTRHLINANVLQALGQHGFLVNVARGSVVDTAALATALEQGVIAGAGLDVYEGEPAPPALLLASGKVVLTPHVGGRSPEAIANTITLFLSNAAKHFAGAPVLTPI